MPLLFYQNVKHVRLQDHVDVRFGTALLAESDSQIEPKRGVGRKDPEANGQGKAGGLNGQLFQQRCSDPPVLEGGQDGNAAQIEFIRSSFHPPIPDWFAIDEEEIVGFGIGGGSEGWGPESRFSIDSDRQTFVEKLLRFRF